MNSKKIQKVILIYVGIFLNLFFSVHGFSQVAGDISLIGWNTDGNDSIALVTYVDIPGNTIFFIRDDEWNGVSEFTDTDEGTLSWKAPAQGLKAGSIIVFDKTGNCSIGTITTIDNGFDPTNSSDQIWIYTATQYNTPPSNFLFAYETANTIFGGNASNTALEQGKTIFAFGNKDNWRYKRTVTYNTLTQIKNAVQQADNWEFSDGVGNQSFIFETTPILHSTRTTYQPYYYKYLK